jgi:hypothetical protein
VSAVDLLIVCAWCERVRNGAARWEEADQQPTAGEATHGICPECLATQKREAAAVLECR